MKKPTLFHLTLGFLVIPFLASILVLPPRQARAQESGYPESTQGYSREELAQMLAPVALYPDVLLSQVLMASTYPIEVIEADRWIRNNPGLEGDALDEALLNRDWDPSVKEICHFPSILSLMSERISETTDLGNAFLAQEGEVMDMVQELRASAYAHGNLTGNSRQRVVVERDTIVIEPAAPRVVYVPYYDPFLVYGPWWYPAYPPWYWGPSGVRIGVGLSYWPAFHFSFSYGSWSYFDWPRRIIFIDVHKRPRYVRHDRWIVKPGRWLHVSHHRRGVAYRDTFTARKYGKDPRRFREYGRNVRGFPEHGNLHRGRDRRIDNRSGIERGKRVNDRSEFGRHRQEGERVLRDRQERARGEVERQKKDRVEHERRVREQVASDRQKRQLIDRRPQERERSEDERRDPGGVERERQVREQVGRDSQKGQTTHREKRERKDDRPDRQEQGRFGRIKDSS
jgi:hypothetical protein